MNIKSISDLSKYANANPGKIAFGLNAEFYSRPDGYKPLQKAYDFKFPEDKIIKMDPGLLYKALKEKFPDTKSLGVKQGPFYVLVGATMPSILVETAFLSNVTEESRLKDTAFHTRAAEGILNGIQAYISALN